MLFQNDTVVIDTKEEIKNVNDTNIYITTNLLTISQASVDRSGRYHCEIGNSVSRYYEESIWIPVYYVDQSIITFSYFYENPFNQMDRQIKIFIRVHPKPTTIQWYDNNNHIISSSSSYSNYIINTSPKESLYKTNYVTTLTFKTIDFEHFGNYTVVVKNIGEESNFSVNVNVTGKPKMEMFIEKLNEYNVTIKCVAVAYPEPKIEWFSKKCTDLKSCLDFTDVDYIEMKGIEYENHNLTSISYITVSLQENRIIRCQSSNNLSKIYLDEPIFNRYELYVDENDMYIQNEGKIVDVLSSKNLNLVCGVPNYIYTGEIAWFSMEKDTYSYSVDVYDKKTDFLLLSISKQIGSSGSKEGIYFTCNFLHRNGSLKSETILVKSQGYILIHENNLQNSSHEVDLGQKWTFYCYYRGIPRPSIRWYKDQQTLESSDRIKYLNKNQVIEFEYLTENDEGYYSCEVYSEYDTKFMFARLTITTYNNFTWLYVQMSLILLVFIFITFVMCLIRYNELNLRQKLRELGLDYDHNDKKQKERLVSELDIEEQVDVLIYDKKWEVLFENIKLDKKLGTGAFGVVYEAKIIKKNSDDDNATVAVKTANLNSGFEGARALASELKILGYVGNHVNIVNLLGACTRSVLRNELYVIVEYCAYGSLRDHVQLYSEHFIDQKNSEIDEFDWSIGIDQKMEYVKMVHDYVNHVEVKEGTSDHEVEVWISSKDFLVWSLQISQGMEYLGSRKIVHRDLATRNVLLANNNIVKICDFGLSRRTYNYDIYSKTLQDRLPFRWMAIESIKNGVFSTKSDVWSFGVLLWELFSLGATPYPGIVFDGSFCKLLEDGYRMEAPQPTTQKIYQIILDCWNSVPSMRPSFSDLSHRIGQFLEESVREHYVDTNNDYTPMNQKKIDPSDNYLSMAGPSSKEKTGADCSVKEDVVA